MSDSDAYAKINSKLDFLFVLSLRAGTALITPDDIVNHTDKVSLSRSDVINYFEEFEDAVSKVEGGYRLWHSDQLETIAKHRHSLLEQRYSLMPKEDLDSVVLSFTGRLNDSIDPRFLHSKLPFMGIESTESGLLRYKAIEDLAEYDEFLDTYCLAKLYCSYLTD